MNFLNSKAGAVVIAVALGVFVAYIVARKAKEGAAAVANSVNPVNPDNVFADAVNAIGDALDNAEDDNSFSLGGWIYDLTHREYDPNAMLQSDSRDYSELNKEAIS